MTIHHRRALGERVQRRRVDDVIRLKHDRAVPQARRKLIHVAIVQLADHPSGYQCHDRCDHQYPRRRQIRRCRDRDDRHDDDASGPIPDSIARDVDECLGGSLLERAHRRVEKLVSRTKKRARNDSLRSASKGGRPEAGPRGTQAGADGNGQGQNRHRSAESDLREQWFRNPRLHHERQQRSHHVEDSEEREQTCGVRESRIGLRFHRVVDQDTDGAEKYDRQRDPAKVGVLPNRLYSKLGFVVR